MPGYVSILLWKTGMFNSEFGLFWVAEKTAISQVLSCVVSCVPQTKPTPLLLASITSERWFCRVHMRSRSCMKTPCFQGLYASKQLQKSRTTSYGFETNNRRSGPKGRGFESRHFDTLKTLANAGVFLFSQENCPHRRGQFLLRREMDAKQHRDVASRHHPLHLDMVPPL